MISSPQSAVALSLLLSFSLCFAWLSLLSAFNKSAELNFRLNEVTFSFPSFAQKPSCISLFSFFFSLPHTQREKDGEIRRDFSPLSAFCNYISAVLHFAGHSPPLFVLLLLLFPLVVVVGFAAAFNKVYLAFVPCFMLIDML